MRCAHAISPLSAIQSEYSIPVRSPKREGNQPLVEMLQRVAKAKGATAAQVSLTWTLAKWPFVTPIPGSRRTKRIEENLGAADVEISPSELDTIEEELHYGK
jgi:aryl-alcohol dehydrogenase-like predicted oxidoreductase